MIAEGTFYGRLIQDFSLILYVLHSFIRELTQTFDHLWIYVVFNI